MNLINKLGLEKKWQLTGVLSTHMPSFICPIAVGPAPQPPVQYCQPVSIGRTHIEDYFVDQLTQ